MSHGRNFGLATKYLLLFEPYLRNKETLLNAGQTVHVEVASSSGRGQGEGVIGLTDQRIIVVYHDKPIRTPFMIEGSDVVSVTRNWILLPGSSNLRIREESLTTQKFHNFYVANRFSREIIELSKEWVNES